MALCAVLCLAQTLIPSSASAQISTDGPPPFGPGTFNLIPGGEVPVLRGTTIYEPGSAVAGPPGTKVTLSALGAVPNTTYKVTIGSAWWDSPCATDRVSPYLGTAQSDALGTIPKTTVTIPSIANEPYVLCFRDPTTSKGGTDGTTPLCIPDFIGCSPVVLPISAWATWSWATSGVYFYRASEEVRVPPSTAPETVIEEGPPAVTRSTSATFRFRSTQPASTFDCRLDSGPWEVCTSPKTYAALSDGVHLFDVRARNAIGQPDESPASWQWRVDTTPPETQITSAPPTFSNSSNASFSFAANEQDVAFECQLDSGAWEGCTSPKTYVGLAERTHSFAVRATDTAGNVDPTPAGHSWTVDLTPPETTITSGPSGPTASTDATFTFSSPEAGSTFECSLDGGGFSGCSSPKTYSSLSDGGHVFQVRAVDRAGNVDGSPDRRDWSAHSPPSISLSGPLADAQGNPLTDDAYDLWIETGSSIGVRSIEIQVDGSTVDYVSEPCPPDDDRCTEDRIYTFPPDAYALGFHTVTVIARDVLGNTSQSSISANVGQPNDVNTSTSATPARQTGAGPGCTLFEFGTVEEGVDLVVHGNWEGGTESTEYLSSREYRITRCTPDGELTVQQHVAPVRLPDGQLLSVVVNQTVPVATLPAMRDVAIVPEYLTVGITYRHPIGTTALDWIQASAGVIRPTPTQEPLPEPDHTDDQPGGTDRGCQSDAFLVQHEWRFNPRYTIHRDSLPNGGRSRRRVLDGHEVWARTSDDCGLRDRTDFRMPFEGMSGQHVQLGDGRDRVDFGPITGEFAIGECNQQSLACTYTFSDRVNGRRIARESDIRFNRNPPGGEWYSGAGSPGGNQYDLFSTAAHESGHKLGLGHVPQGTDQTMCAPCGIPGYRYRRTLGLGDVRGLRRLYRGVNLGQDPR